VVGQEGENAQLDCYASGHPAPEVYFVTLVSIGFIPLMNIFLAGFMRIMNFYIQEVFKGTAKVL
jgi:hypothetical protein